MKVERNSLAVGLRVLTTPGALTAATLAFGWAGRAPHAPMVF